MSHSRQSPLAGTCFPVFELARQEATAVVSADPGLSGHPALRAAIDDLLGPQADYLDKT